MTFTLGDPATRDNTLPVTEAEFREGMYISLAIGLYYTMNTFAPIIAWYGWRRVPVRALTNNRIYQVSWYMLYASHFIIYLPMAVMWPFSYIGSSVIVEFYDIAQTWIATIGGGGVLLLVTLFWTISALAYKDNEIISKREMVQEIFLYILIEGFAWYVSVWEWPKAKN